MDEIRPKCSMDKSMDLAGSRKLGRFTFNGLRQTRTRIRETDVVENSSAQVHETLLVVYVVETTFVGENHTRMSGNGNSTVVSLAC